MIRLTLWTKLFFLSLTARSITKAGLNVSFNLGPQRTMVKNYIGVRPLLVRHFTVSVRRFPYLASFHDRVLRACSERLVPKLSHAQISQVTGENVRKKRGFLVRFTSLLEICTSCRRTVVKCICECNQSGRRVVFDPEPVVISTAFCAYCLFPAYCLSQFQLGTSHPWTTPGKFFLRERIPVTRATCFV